MVEQFGSGKFPTAIACVCLALLEMGSCSRVATAPAHYALRKLGQEIVGGGDSSLSPDGKAFATSLHRDGNWDVWIFHIDTGKWRQVTHNKADDFEAQWAPDGETLVFTSTRFGNKDVFTLNLKTGEEKRLTDDQEDDEYPNFSPDGKWIVYTGGPWKRRDYFLVSVDGSQRRRASQQSGMAGACSFRRDGEAALICHGYDSGTGNVALYPLTGGFPIPVTVGRFWDYKPTMSPTHQWIAFSRSEEGPSRVFMQPLQGGVGRPLTNSDGDDRWPTWDISGNRILFHRLVDRGQTVKILDKETGQVRAVTDKDEQAGQATFHPNGRVIAYTVLTTTGSSLRIRDLENGAVRTVPLSTPEAASPRWSPDGRHLAFLSKPAGRWEIATANPDGSNEKVWTEGLLMRGLKGPVDWSPDSKHLVFQTSTHPFESDIYILDIADGKITNLTADDWFDDAPSFSRDGKSVIFMSTRGGGWSWSFYRWPLAGGAPVKLYGPDFDEKNYPREAKSGGLLYSAYDHDGVEYLAQERDGKQTFYTRAGPWSRWPSESPDGLRILYTTVEHRVEYWLAENVFAKDSPAMSPPKPEPVRISKVKIASYVTPMHLTNSSTVRSSPIQYHHR